MTERPSAFATIAGAPPGFSSAEAIALAKDHYGLAATTATALVSERDQNFLLRQEDGRQFVLKIAGAAEAPAVTDYQIAALEHVASRCPEYTLAPTVLRTSSGERRISLTKGGRVHLCRVVTYLPGVPLAGRPLHPTLCRSFGERLATLDRALADFSYAGGEQELLWDMRRAPKLLELLEHVPDDSVRALCESTLSTFERTVLPRFAQLRRQTIHNDANPANVLVADGEERISGIIDFGDMLEAPLIVDVAIAAAYLRSLDGDAFAFIRPFLAAYDATNRLAEDEFELLHELIKTRLATTIVILFWRASLRDDDDAYLRQTQASEGGATRFLARLAAVPGTMARGVYRTACGR